MNIDFNLNNRYSRNHLFYNLYGADHLLVQKKLLSKHVTIIGCGGIGSHISYLLTTAGIGKITLVDNDIIEVSNLNRQFLFTEQDIGKKKTKILSRELKKRNSLIEINTIEININSEKDIKKYLSQIYMLYLQIIHLI